MIPMGSPMSIPVWLTYLSGNALLFDIFAPVDVVMKEEAANDAHDVEMSEAMDPG
jgi:hypothetical protein